jgi:hypothetical protein
MKPSYNITIVEIVWYCLKFRYTSQWNEFDNPEKSWFWELNCYEGFTKIHMANVAVSTNAAEAIRQHV